MKVKDLIRILESENFVLSRYGKHRVYTNGQHSIPVPLSGKEVNRMLARRIIKQINAIKAGTGTRNKK